MLSPVKERHKFHPRDFVAGKASIDFVNTVTGRNGTPRDWLMDHSALLAWGVEAGVVSEAEARLLAYRYQADPPTADVALSKAVALRDAMYRLLKAITSEEIPSAECLDTTRQAWQEAASAAHLRWSDANGLIVGTDAVIDRVALEFVALGSDLASPRLRQCAGEDCGWFFIDSSKAGRRRWCDMATCGNAAKYARFKG